MRHNTLEIIMGMVVLVAAAFFVVIVYQAADIRAAGGYQIKAEFGTTGGLTVGDDVRLSGIKIGRITDQTLDPISYNAVIEMNINDEVELPADTSARITEASLLGGNFLELIPGGSDEMLAAGDVIYDTFDPVSLSDLLGKFVFQNGEDEPR